MHKKFQRLRESGLPVFLNGATLACHAKAPVRRAGVNDSSDLGLRAPGSAGAAHADRRQTGEWRSRSRDRGSAAAVGSRLRPGSATGSESSVGLRASVFFGEKRRSLPARERRFVPGWRVSFGRFAGGAAAPGLLAGFGSGAWNTFGVVRQPWRDGVLRSRSDPAGASGACGAACLRAWPCCQRRGVCAEGFGCWFARTPRAGIEPRQGLPFLPRSAPYRQVRRRPYEERHIPPQHSCGRAGHGS
jgi:hypothetical protein